MHKMELGDSVYAAERIMKKRIRKVSFIFIFFLTLTVLKLAKAVVTCNHKSAAVVTWCAFTINCMFVLQERWLA